MDKFPLCRDGKSLGELTVEGEGLYTSFCAECRLPERELWCIWLVGERGELRLGIPEPQGKTAVLRRRFSHRMTAPLGRILRGELRPVSASGAAEWVSADCTRIRTPWLRQQLGELGGVLMRESGSCRLFAAPCDPKRPFPLPALFCFARIRQIAGKSYAVFAFDGDEWPVFCE